jgi:hypothetical protein
MALDSLYYIQKRALYVARGRTSVQAGPSLAASCMAARAPCACEPANRGASAAAMRRAEARARRRCGERASCGDGHASKRTTGAACPRSAPMRQLLHARGRVAGVDVTADALFAPFAQNAPPGEDALLSARFRMFSSAPAPSVGVASSRIATPSLFIVTALIPFAVLDAVRVRLSTPSAAFRARQKQPALDGTSSGSTSGTTGTIGSASMSVAVLGLPSAEVVDF